MTRAHLLLTTALVLAAVPLGLPQAQAQTPPAPNTLPTGMRVVAGSAGAVTQGPTLTVNQTSGRAALDWNSFNIGSAAGVRFNDPSPGSLTLNRVTNQQAAIIAGHLSSNGGLVLIDQAGVVLMPTAVVNAQSVVFSASGITEQNMRRGVATGRFLLDQPAHPGARVVNQGNISVRRAGLAALVAPQVANSGTISAPFGTVTLAGVTSNVVDLYGDGLLSLDVTRQTMHGANGAAALVTNDGLIVAEGGRVTLSTAAVDGLVTNLVSAGGTISTDSAGARGGRILIDAAGGTALVTGQISARGTGAASVGGRIALRGSEAVGLMQTARVDASGTAGGGVVAIGTTLKRARGGPGTRSASTSKIVSVAPGATVAADATGSGNGGIITVLSTDSTVMAGNLSARGGALAGDGGVVEVSGGLGYALLGNVDVTAARGRAGGLVIDPGNLTVDPSGTAVLTTSGTDGMLTVAPGAPDAVISPATLMAFSGGSITLTADQNLVVSSLGAFSLGATHPLFLNATNGSIDILAGITSATSISMQAGGGITIEASGSVTASGLSLTAGTDLILNGPVQSTSSGIFLQAGGVITIAGTVNAASELDILSAASVTEQTGGAIITPFLTTASDGGPGIAGAVDLTQPNNQVQAIGDFFTGGGFALTNAVSLNVSGLLQVGTGEVVSLKAPQIGITSNGGTIGFGGSIEAPAGVVELAPLSGLVTLGTTTATGFSLSQGEVNQIATGLLRIGEAGGTVQASAITIAGSFDVTTTLSSIPTLELDAQAGGISITSGPLVANTLLLGTTGSVTQSATDPSAFVSASILGSVGTIGGSVELPSTGNFLDTLGPLASSGEVNLGNAFGLVVAGPVSTGTSGFTLDVAGPIIFDGPTTVGAMSLTTTPTEGSSNVTQRSGTITAASLTGSIDGNLSLSSTLNAISVLDALSAGNITIATSTPMAIAGLVQTPTGPETSSTIDLSAGALTETTGALQTTVLTSSHGITGDATLGGDNAISDLTGFGVAGTLSLLNTASLEIDFGVSATNASFRVTGGNTLTIAEPITLATGGTLDMQADAITVTGGATSVGIATNALQLISIAPDSALPMSVGGAASPGTLALSDAFLNQIEAAFGARPSPTLELGAIETQPPTAASITVATESLGSALTLQLESIGAVTQTGPLSVGTLDGGAGSVALVNATNAIAELGNFSTTAGDFVLIDSQALLVSGAVNAGAFNLALSDTATGAPALALLGASVLSGNTVTLSSLSASLAGVAVTQDVSGAIFAQTLSGDVAGGSALLVGSGNRISAIGTLTVAGLLDLTDTVTVTEDTTGVLSAGTLAGLFGGDAILLGNANAVSNLGSITVTGSLALVDGFTNLAGTVTAANMSLIADGIGYTSGALVTDPGTVEIAPRTLEQMSLGPGPGFVVAPAVLATVTADLLRLGEARGNITATGIGVQAAISIPTPVTELDTTIAGSSTGAVTEASGASLTLSNPAGTLTGTTGPVSLTLTNTVPQLGPYAVFSGDFALTDSTPLAVVGDVSAANIALNVAGPLTLSTGSLFAGTVDLTANGASEVSGIIFADTLESTGVPTGTFSLDGANQVNTLGVWNGPASSLSLVTVAIEGGTPLTVTGPVSVSALVLSAPTLTLAGNVTSTGVVDLVTTDGAVVQSSGTLSTPLLTGNVVGASSFGDAGNAVLQLGPYVSGGAFALVDGTPLTVVAPVTAPGIAIATPGSLTIADVLSAAGATVDLTAAGATETGRGAVIAQTLLSSGTPTGAFALTGPNQVASLGPFQMASGGTLTLADTEALSIGGPVAASVVDLSTSAGGIAETTGDLVAGVLQSSSGIVGGAILTAAGNSVGALGNIPVSGGDFVLAQSGPLLVAGRVAAPDITLRTGALTIAGVLQASGTVALGAAGVAETGGGAVVASVLTDAAGASGAYILDGPGNAVAALGAFQNGEASLLLVDNQALTVAGPVILPTSLTLSAPAITLAGNVTAATAEFDTSAGGLVQTAGALSTGLLSSTNGIAGVATLADPGNVIAQIGPFSAQGLSLADAGNLAIVAPIVAPAGLDLAVSGALVEPGGSIATGSLTGHAGSATLVQPANAIGALNFATSGAFDLTDAQSLTVLGLSGGGAALHVTGDLVLAGSVNEAGSPVLLNVSGSVTQTGGVLTAGLLAGQATVFLLPSPNAVAGLGDITAAGGFTLLNAHGLAIAGALRAAVVDLSVTQGGITEQPNGTVVTGQLLSSSGIVGDAVLDPGNLVAVLGPLHDTGRFLLLNGEALTVGNVSVGTVLDLSTTVGGVTENGPITAPVLQSSFGIAGAARFDNAANQIAGLGPLSVNGGDLILVTNPTVIVTGPVAAPNITLVTNGGILQQGDIVAPGTLSVTTMNVYQRNAGALVAGTLTGRVVSTADFGAGAQVQRLGVFTVNDVDDGFPGAAAFSTLILHDAIPMTLAGPIAADYVALSATGTLTWSGNITTLGVGRFSQAGSPATLPSPGSYLSVDPGVGGTGTINQVGTVQVFSQDAGISTLRLQLPRGGGSITLNNLVAPTTDLILSTGPGSATGTINVGDLLELSTPGVVGSANLFGTVHGLLGFAAATQSGISPLINANYRVNTCIIMSTCNLLLPQITSTVVSLFPQLILPLDFAIGQARDNQDDSDVLLPGVAEQDY